MELLDQRVSRKQLVNQEGISCKNVVSTAQEDLDSWRGRSYKAKRERSPRGQVHGRKGLAADVCLEMRVKGGLAKPGHQGNVRTGLEALSRAKTVRKCLRQH